MSAPKLSQQDLEDLKQLTDEELQLEVVDAEESLAFLKECQDAILAEVERRKKGRS